MTSRGNTQPGEFTPKCLDIVSWRSATLEEIKEFLDSRRKSVEDRQKQRRRSVLAVRRSLVPVDVYCYLRARFGEPNGIQNFLRKNHSDNLFHWDFILRAGDEEVYIAGMSREIQLAVSAVMTDRDWRNLIVAIKNDYKRVAKEKSAVLKSLEHWVIFPNRYVAIAELCADLHATIKDDVGGFRIYSPGSGTFLEQEKAIKEMDRRAKVVYRACLQLSILAPILAEAFINLVILTLCKPEIRANQKHLDEFIRSKIHDRIIDLASKCDGFARKVDRRSTTYRKFLKVMNKRNDTIHGNHNPEQEQIERVYFEGTRPLFVQPGDQIGKFFEALERQYRPESVANDYEDVQEFLAELTSCMKPDIAAGLRRIAEDPFPGFDIRRKKMGALFPGHYVSGNLEGVRFDDELAVVD
jgi:hypothetical protein